jgi:hypothetical protein
MPPKKNAQQKRHRYRSRALRREERKMLESDVREAEEQERLDEQETIRTDNHQQPINIIT